MLGSTSVVKAFGVGTMAVSMALPLQHGWWTPIDHRFHRVLASNTRVDLSRHGKYVQRTKYLCTNYSQILSVDVRNEPVGRPPRPSVPLRSEFFPHDFILRRDTRQQHAYKEHPPASPHTRKNPAPPAAQPDTLAEPAALRKLEQACSNGNRDAAYVARVAHDRVRPASDECVVLLHGHRPGEEPPEGAVAREAEGAACTQQRAAREPRRRQAHAVRGSGAGCEQG